MTDLAMWPWGVLASLWAASVVFAYTMGKTVGRDEEIKRRSKMLRNQR